MFLVMGLALAAPMQHYTYTSLYRLWLRPQVACTPCPHLIAPTIVFGTVSFKVAHLPVTSLESAQDQDASLPSITLLS